MYECGRAELSLSEAAQLVEVRYGLKVSSVAELKGYDDRNFHVETEDGGEYVLKVINEEDSRKTEVIEALGCLATHLSRVGGFRVPLPVANSEGGTYSVETIDRRRHAVRLLLYHPGRMLADAEPSVPLYRRVGALLARLDNCMQSFNHEVYTAGRLDSLWMLRNAPKVRDFYHVLDGHQTRLPLVEQTLLEFEQSVLPRVASLQTGVVHGDFNMHNILISDEQEITAVLDLGDSHTAPYIFELAICVCYMLVHSRGELSFGRYVLQGYTQHKSLPQSELALLKPCISARLCQSLILGLHSYKRNQDSYVIDSQKYGWHVLQQLAMIDRNKLIKIWTE